jgi:hypothetical protein
MKRFVAPGLVVIAGLVFIVVTLAQNLFSVGTAFESLIDDFRPVMQDEAIDQYRADIAGLHAVSVEFPEEVLPALAGALGLTPDSLGGLIAAQYPAVNNGLALLPEAVPTFGGLIDTLAGQQSNFLSADEIPTKSLPAQTVPWGFTIVGLIAVGLGAFLLLKGTRVSAILALTLGVLIVAGSFVLSLPGKSGDTDSLKEALEPVYTVETVEGAKGTLAVIGAMGQEMGTGMMSDLGGMLGMDTDTLNQFFGANFPATAQAVQRLPEAMGRFYQLVKTFDDNLDNYETLKPVTFLPIIWIFIIGGFVIIGGGALGFVWTKDDEEQSA